jgi:hypothetical protein
MQHSPTDFSTWTLDDPDDRLMMAAHRISWTQADRTLFRQVRLDNTEESIGDLRHCFSVQFTGALAVSAENCGLIRLWECRNSWTARIWTYARYEVDSPNHWTIHFEQVGEQSSSWEWHGSTRFELGATYRVTVEREDRSCRLRVSPHGSMKETLEDSGTLRCMGTAYREIWICSTLRAKKNRENWSSGFIENLCLE